MAVEHELSAKKRELGKKNLEEVREQGFVPGVVYGKGKENINIIVEKNILNKVFNKAGENSLISLSIEGEKDPKNVLVYEVQQNPVTDDIVHMDFYEVNMAETVETEVPLAFVGESAAVKELGGTFSTNKDSVLVKSLPINIPKEIEVDIAKLATFEDSILASDIKLPADVELLTELDETITTVNPPRSEEELADLEADVEADVDSVGDAEEKKEGEEGEGEEKAGDDAPEKKEDAPGEENK